MTIAGLVLANGLSRRMGREKATLKLGGKTLASRAVDTLRLQRMVEEVALNASGDPARFETNAPLVEDAFPDHAGPLSGIQAGLEWANSEGHDRLLSVAIDTPFFPEDLADELSKSDAPIVVAKTYRLHPVFALWDVSLAADLHAFLDRGRRKIMEFVEGYSYVTCSFGVSAVDPFFNVNTPEDFERAEALLS